MPKNKHMGSGHDAFLKEEGVIEEFQAQAIKEVIMSTAAASKQPIAEQRLDEARIAHYEAKLAFEIDSWDLRTNEADVIIVDARSTSAFEKEHIPHAISFPHRTMNRESTSNFRRDVLYVTYCDGIGCNASTKGALNLARLGFRVKELMGGLDWWKRDGYETASGSQRD
ncbi:MAG TPA: rhodanese-like domain-containing protein [Beijerinckiaceae bacterium]|nr:rhodanese-like domain-containing protein [Beijerinckiaceae bacterium]